MVSNAYGLERRINRFLNDAFGTPNWEYRDGTRTSWVPPVDVFEDANGIRILAEVPGVRPEDVKISVENDVLTIQGAKRETAEEKTEQVHRYERAYGVFERTFTLPNTVDAANIKATYEHGVLRITLPKAEKARPRQIQVQVTA